MKRETRVNERVHVYLPIVVAVVMFVVDGEGGVDGAD